jgi:hypothetical protein
MTTSIWHSGERMKNGIELHSRAPAARATAGGAPLIMLSIALAVAGMACGAIDDPSVRDGALRGWYLPLGLLLTLLRAAAPHDTRRVLSLALVILGVGALAARAVDARGAGSDRGASAELSAH